MNKFSLHPLYHYALACDLLSNTKLNVLDYGCGTGEFIGGLGSRAGRVYGYDVDPQRINSAHQRFPRLRLALGKVNQLLPYADKSFDVVTMFHVLEHVGSESRAIRDVHRVLKKEGLFLLASPYQGLFAWADMANMRYRFPKVHKWVARFLMGESEYLRRFSANKKLGLYGDCTASRKWHKRYTEDEIRVLLKNKFEILKIVKFSLFYPFLLIPHDVFNHFFKPQINPTVLLIYLDNLIRAGDLSYNFFLVARKI